MKMHPRRLQRLHQPIHVGLSVCCCQAQSQAARPYRHCWGPDGRHVKSCLQDVASSCQGSCRVTHHQGDYGRAHRDAQGARHNVHIALQPLPMNGLLVWL